MEDIEISTQTNGKVHVATASECGRRWDMEDEHKVMLDVQTPFAGHLHYAAVFDGHGGKRTSRWCRDNLHKYLGRMSDAKPNTIKQTWIDADADQRDASADDSGCTAAVVAILPTDTDVWDIVSMHAGDSRVLLVTEQAVVATEDHKPERVTEEARIIAAGGSVYAPHGGQIKRLDGNLSVSRGFGDHPFKSNRELDQASQKLTVVPDIDNYRVTARTRVVLMCDGVFEHLTNELVADIIREAATPEDCARDVVSRAYSSGSDDNLSVVAIWLEAPGRPLYAPTRPQTPVD